MAEEFQAGVCSGIWLNSSRSSVGLSPCLISINDVGGFGWPSSDLAEMKGRTSIGTTDESGLVSGGGLIDSTSQMMAIGLSSSSSSSSTITQDWNQTLLSGKGGSERNFHCSMLQEDLNSRMNFRKETGNMDCPQIQEWNSNINESKQTNQGFSVDQGLPPTSFPMSSASYSFPSTLLQTLFDSDSPPQQSLFDNRPMNYQPNFNEISPSLAKLPSPSLPKERPISDFPLTNSTSFWNASTAALNDISASVFPPTQPPQLVASIFEEKPNCPNLAAKANNEAVRSLVSKSSSEPAFKRTRIETPSPLPTFKVRKEKLGDRVTALQQLVSPFGKTDTASVLHEAIEYIKYLHEQVGVLSTPYMKIGAPIQHQKDHEGSEQDLKSRGLCLVPISSTYPVASETTADFWMTPFGGTFR